MVENKTYHCDMHPVQKIKSEVEELLSEVEAFCLRHGISPLTFSNRVLGGTYTLGRMASIAARLDGNVQALWEAMAEMVGVDPGGAATAPPPPAYLKDPLIPRVTLSLPVPPSTNHLYIGWGRGRRRHPSYTAWVSVAGNEILTQRPALPVKRLPPGPYGIDTEIPITDPGDIDNRNKALLDLLRDMGITPDDRHLHDARIRRSADLPAGRITATVWAMAGGDG